MTTKMMGLKNETKETIAREEDRYFDELARCCSNQRCKIGEFERVTVEHRRRLDEILRDTAGKAMSLADTENKKMP